MKVYVETNFILQLVFQQEQTGACETLLNLCESGKINLVVPAYSLVEQNEKLVRQARERQELQQRLEIILRQLARTTLYATRITRIENIGQLLIESNREDQQRLIQYRSRFFKAAQIIALTTEILQLGADYEKRFSLNLQDGVVLASIISHLKQNSTGDESCFLTQNSKDFGPSSIKSELDQNNCRLIFSFDDGMGFVRSRL